MDAATNLFGWIAKILVAERLKNIDLIGKVKCPVFLIHGLRDKIIPYQHSEKLLERCTQESCLILPETMDHNDFNFTSDFYIYLKTFLDKIGFYFNYNKNPNHNIKINRIPEKLFIPPHLRKHSGIELIR